MPGRIQYVDENGDVQIRNMTGPEIAQNVQDEAAWRAKAKQRDFNNTIQPAVDAFLEDRMLARADDEDAPQALKNWKAARDQLP